MNEENFSKEKSAKLWKKTYLKCMKKFKKKIIKPWKTKSGVFFIETLILVVG